MAGSRGPSPFYQPPQGGLGLTLRNDVNGDLRITEIYPGSLPLMGPCNVRL